MTARSLPQTPQATLVAAPARPQTGPAPASPGTAAGERYRYAKWRAPGR